MVKILNIQNKGRILNPAKEQFKVSLKGCPIRITPDFSKETQRAWTDHCRLLVTTDAGPEYNTQKELIITIGGESKIYHDKVKFKSYVFCKSSTAESAKRSRSKLRMSTCKHRK